MPLADLSTAEIYTRFIELQSHYAERNYRLATLTDFFEGTQWASLAEAGEQPEGEEVAEREEIRLVLNYARKSVLWHVALMSGKPPRIDVPSIATGTDLAATRREHFLRAMTKTVSFTRAYRAVEMNAAKLGFGVLQIIWDPPEGQPITRDVPKAEGSTAAPTQAVYTESPMRFRSIPPNQFFPCYRTHDHPNDLLYALRYEPARLIEDLEEKYGVELRPTDDEAGTAGTCELVEFWDRTRYVLIAITTAFDGEGEKVQTPHVLKDEDHGYGFIPFIILPNIWSDPNEDPTNEGCISEVAQIRDVNVHLNLIMSLSAEEIATRIHPPAVYKTDDPQQNIKNIRLGAGEVIPIGADEDLAPLDWKGVPQSVAEHRTATMQAIQDFSGMPRTSLGGGAGAAQSGIGMKLAYTALEMILPLKIPLRKEFHQVACARMLQLSEEFMGKATISLWYDDQQTAASRRLIKDDIRQNHICIVTYGNLIPRDEVQHEQHIVYLFKTGCISLRTALELLDFIDDPEAEMGRIKEEAQDAALNPEKATMVKQALGRDKPQQQPGAQPGTALPAMPPPMTGPPGPSGAEALKFNAAPPVPTSPSMPTQQNAPFLQRGVPPNLGQMFPGGPGVNQGPPIEGQP